MVVLYNKQGIAIDIPDNAVDDTRISFSSYNATKTYSNWLM